MNGMIEWTVRALADRMGLEMVPKGGVERNQFAKHLRVILDRIEADTIIDVGANAGQYHDFLRDHVGFAGEIH